MKKLWKRNMVAGAVLLLVCGAIFLNGRYAQQVEETDKILGQATLVDGTEGDAEEAPGAAPTTLRPRGSRASRPATAR